MDAVAYLRVSGKEQIKKGGFPRQRDSISKFAKSRKIEIVGEYQEKGISGTAGIVDESKRPAFHNMMSTILSNGCRVVIVEALDRVARELEIQMQIATYLATKGVTLYSAQTGENVTEAITADPMRRAMIQVQGTFAELDKSLLVLKLKKGRANRDKQLKRSCEGRVKFGLKSLGKGETTEDADQQATLKRMKSLRRKRKGVERMSYQKIADTLNREGFPTAEPFKRKKYKKGGGGSGGYTTEKGQWTWQTVRNILG